MLMKGVTLAFAPGAVSGLSGSCAATGSGALFTRVQPLRLAPADCHVDRRTNCQADSLRKTAMQQKRSMYKIVA